MPKYAHVESVDPPIVAFYDTDAIDYPNLPSDLVPLNDEDWALRLTGHRWTIVNGRLVAAPPSDAQQAAEEMANRINAGILVTSTSNPSINARYALDAITLDQIGSVARDFAAGLGLPGGASVFFYPDADGTMHAFTGPQIVGLYQAQRNYLLLVNTQGAVMRQGGPPQWPDNAVTIV